MISVHNSRVIARWLYNNSMTVDKGDPSGIYVTAKASKRSEEQLIQLSRELQVLWSIASMLGGRIYTPRVYLRILGDTNDKDT